MRRCQEKTWRPHTQAFTAPPHLCESHLWKMTTQKELKVTLTSEVSYIIVHTVDYISESDNLTSQSYQKEMMSLHVLERLE